MKQEGKVKDQRRAAIVERVHKDGKIYVTELAKELEITPETLRRDLAELEESRLVTRVHGGAIPYDGEDKELVFEKKMNQNQLQKKRVAKEAASHIQSHMTIAVDIGTSTMYVADYLNNISNLTVVTNSLAAVYKFNKAIEEGRVQADVIMLPGITNPYQASVKGVYTTDFLQPFSFDLTLLSCGGVTEAAIFDFDAEESVVSRTMAEKGKKVILLTDESKLDHRRNMQICQTNILDLLICDCDQPEDWQDFPAQWQHV